MQTQPVDAKPKPTVWITGTGVVSCVGGSVDELWQATRNDRSGIVDGLGRVETLHIDESSAELRANRALGLSVRAVREAMAQARWSNLEPGDGIILGTTTGQLLKWDFSFMDLINDRISPAEFRDPFKNQPLGELLGSLRRHLSHVGPSMLITSACSASTQALALGAMWIRQGRVKRCLVGGVEVLCDLTREGFRSLHLLSLDHAQPFDRDRRGINLSEGAAFICLEGSGSAMQAPLAQLAGFGFSTDGYHMTGPHPEGEGSYQAMSRALEVANIDAADVDWVHAHGTGSVQNDLAEGLAVLRLFGKELPWISSTKWVHGHALGASGALETALIIKAMRNDLILSTRGLVNPDPKIAVNHPLKDNVQKVSHVLKSTLGFGGTNAALLISHPDTGHAR